MIPYTAPIKDMTFVMRELGLLDAVAALPGHEDVTPDLLDAVLNEAGRLSSEVIAPLNQEGDKTGAALENGVVRTPPGFKDAYDAFVEGGWNGIPFDPEHGGQGLPWSVATAVQEMWQSANLSWALCPLLNIGAVECLAAHGSEQQKAVYLEKMVSGTWTGTMNLTEPQAGSDLSLIKAKAFPDGERYRIKGQKIYITYGEHEWTENIIHLVLARLPDAPEGVKGISLFLVPKFLVNDDGTVGPRNDVKCVSLEHKLGINASPTYVMAYGDDEGAVGYLVGEPHRGLSYMFTMMNNARLNVGLQGLAIAERAYQQARDYAKDRRQGRADEQDSVTIIHHPDVRRMLMTMKAQIEAMRGVIYDTAAAIDRAKRDPDQAGRADWQARVDLMIPVVKAWCTDLGVEIASIGVQVHGGMGFIEETGAAQHLRDARIAPIYEGTNGIQAADLVGRKVLRDQGRAVGVYLRELDTLLTTLSRTQHEDLGAIFAQLSKAVDALEVSTHWILDEGTQDQAAALAGSAPYLRLFGVVAGGANMARQAIAAAERIEAGDGDAAFQAAKIATARFYAENILPQSRGLMTPITQGHGSVMGLAEDAF